jgi:hypothetical protein
LRGILAAAILTRRSHHALTVAFEIDLVNAAGVPQVDC